METPPSHLDSEETRQVTREAFLKRAASEVISREKRLEAQSTGSKKPEGRGGEGREDIPFRGCALAPAQAKRGRFPVLSQAPASATLFTSCLFITAGSKPGIGLCDLYDYKPPKGTESWQGMDKATSKPPKVKMAIPPPLLTLYPTGPEVTRPGSGKEEIGGKPQSIGSSYPELDHLQFGAS